MPFYFLNLECDPYQSRLKWVKRLLIKINLKLGETTQSEEEFSDSESVYEESDIDIEKERISLGIKQLTEDVAGTEIDNIRKGSTVTCTIAEITENGIEVSVGDNLQGFIKKNDLSREKADQKTDRYGVGDKVDATVTNIDKKTRKISLSIKAKEIEEEKKAMAEYGSSDSGASLGDILGAALAKKDEKSS